MPIHHRIACFGGLYSNYLAFAAAITDAKARKVDAIYCLGDMGAFGPHPDRVFPLLRENNVQCIQGNYDNSIGYQKEDCQCGYTDPQDNYFAELSYRYTLLNTSPENCRYLRDLPGTIRLQLGPFRTLLCHGSPRRMNEFLWESTTSTHFLDHMVSAHETDIVLSTHTGIKWHRRLSNNRHFINVGVLGRPENDGQTNVWYTLLEATGKELKVDFIPIHYDHDRLAEEMTREQLPPEFIETIQSGYWTTCLEILPTKERARGRW